MIWVEVTDDWNISEENTSFENPVCHKAVHIFADTTHMIKPLRNNFLELFK